MKRVHQGTAVTLAERREYGELRECIRVHPELSSYQDTRGMTCLHWMCSDPQVDIVSLEDVILTWPRALKIRNGEGLLPAHLAVLRGIPLDALKAIFRHYPEALLTPMPDGRSVLEVAQSFLQSTSSLIFLRLLDAELRDDGSGQKHGYTFGPIDNQEENLYGVHGKPPDSLPIVPPRWKLDKQCCICFVKFGYFKNRHHCRNCGGSVCGRHSKHFIPLKHFGLLDPQRVCSPCYEKQRDSPLPSSDVIRTNQAKTFLQHDYSILDLPSTQLRKERSLSAREYCPTWTGTGPPESPPSANISRKARAATTATFISRRSSFEALVSPRASMQKMCESSEFHLSEEDLMRFEDRGDLSFNPSTSSMFLSIARAKGEDIADSAAEEARSPSKRTTSATESRSTAPEDCVDEVEGNQRVEELEEEMQKLLEAKKHLEEAIERNKRQMECARSKKEVYERVAQKYEHQGLELDAGTMVDEDDNTRGSSEARYDSSLDNQTVVAGPIDEDDDRKAYFSPALQLDVAQTHVELGAAMIAKGDHAHGIIEIKKSLDLDPKNAEAWSMLAKSLLFNDELLEAEVAVRRALEVSPSSVSNLSLLGKVLNSRGLHDEAIDVFRQALTVRHQPQ